MAFGGGDEIKTFGYRIEVENVDALDRLRAVQGEFTQKIVEATEAFSTGGLTSEQYIQKMGRLASQLAATERSIRTLKQETDSGAAALEQFNRSGAEQEARLAQLKARIDEVIGSQDRFNESVLRGVTLGDKLSYDKATADLEKFKQAQAGEEAQLAALRQKLDEATGAQERHTTATLRAAEAADRASLDRATADLEKFKQAQVGEEAELDRLKARFEELNLEIGKFARNSLAEVNSKDAASLRESQEATARYNAELAALQASLARAASATVAFNEAQRRREAASINAVIQSETRANLEAAESIDRFNAELAEEELRLKRAKQALDEFLAAENRMNDARMRGASQADQLGRQNTVMGQGFRSLGYQVYFAAQAIEDLQYGFAAVLNNIPLLVMSMGGTAGLAGTISILGVGINTAIKNWETLKQAFSSDTFRPAQQSLESLKKDLEGISGKPWKVDLDYMLIKEADEKIKELEERLQKYEGSRMGSQQRELSRRATEAVDETMGSEAIGNVLLDERGPFRREFESRSTDRRIAGLKQNLEGMRRRRDDPNAGAEEIETLSVLIASLEADIAKQEDEEKKRIIQAVKSEIGAFEKGEIPAINRMRRRVQGEGGDLFGRDFRNFLSAVSPEAIRADQAAASDDTRQEEGNQRYRDERVKRTQRQREKLQERLAAGEQPKAILAAEGDTLEYENRQHLQTTAAAAETRLTKTLNQTGAANQVTGQEQAGLQAERDLKADEREQKAEERAAEHQQRTEDTAARREITSKGLMAPARGQFGQFADLAARPGGGGVPGLEREIGQQMRGQLRQRPDIPRELMDEVAHTIIQNLYNEAATRMVAGTGRGVVGGGAGRGPGGAVAASGAGQAVVGQVGGTAAPVVTTGGGAPVAHFGGPVLSMAPSLPGVMTGGFGASGGFGGFGGGGGFGGFGGTIGVGGFGGMGGMAGMAGFGGMHQTHHAHLRMGGPMAAPVGVAQPFGAAWNPQMAVDQMPMLAAPTMPGLDEFEGGGMDFGAMMTGLGGPVIRAGAGIPVPRGPKARIAAAQLRRGGAGVNAALGAMGGALGGAGMLAGIGGLAPESRQAAIQKRSESAEARRLRSRTQRQIAAEEGPVGTAVGAVVAGAKPLTARGRRQAAAARARGGTLAKLKGASAAKAVVELSKVQGDTIAVASAMQQALAGVLGEARKNGSTVGRIHSWLQSLSMSQPTRQDEG